MHLFIDCTHMYYSIDLPMIKYVCICVTRGNKTRYTVVNRGIIAAFRKYKYLLMKAKENNLNIGNIDTYDIGAL